MNELIFYLRHATAETINNRVVVVDRGQIKVSAEIKPEIMKVDIKEALWNNVDVKSLFEQFAKGVLEEQALLYVRNQ
jgi:hypothetical protein